MARKMIRPLHSEADYDVALNKIERYFENEPKPGTPEADRFDLLALIIEDYERKRWPIEPPDTIDAIRYRMAAFGANIPKWRATIDLLEAADFASCAAEAKWRPRASDSRRDWKMEVR
jgi:antitoxin component HigA of HigAB toxin-antitoxin module